MTAVADLHPALRSPAAIAELGVPEGLVEDLFMRRVQAERTTTIGRVAEALLVSHAIGDEIAEALRRKNLLEYQGAEGRDYRISLTELGFRVTSDRMASGRHVSPVPVPLAHYRSLVDRQRADLAITRAGIRDIFSDLVLEDGILDQIGPAFLNEGAIFLYGPPGTGKTALAERMARFFTDLVLIPHFIEVDGQMISVYDPAVHEAEPEQPVGIDPRYIACRRPLIMVGGELTLDMMDLHHDPTAGLETSPIQLKANNGILVLDDFGRQAASPDDILNRWIVPLSRRIDFLKPVSGSKFTVPFELKLVISTNLDPKTLGDDAFLRRLRNKVHVGPCSETAFNWILVRAAHDHKIEVNAEVAAHLAAVTIKEVGELRPYVAIDFCEMASGVLRYDEASRTVDHRLVDRIASLYFVRSDGAT
jgi:hypothetical protein